MSARENGSCCIDKTMMNDWTRLNYVTAAVGALLAAISFPIFFRGFAGFWENLTDWDGYNRLSIGQCKIIWWVLIIVGGACSARWNLPHWFPVFFQ